MLALAEYLLKPGRTGGKDGLVGFDAVPTLGGTTVDPQGDIAQDLTGQELVERLGQFL